MLAFRVEIDGERPLVAGVDDWSILALHVNAVRADKGGSAEDELFFSVGGLTTENSEGVSHHFRWPRVPLKIGSTVIVTLTETNSADTVAKRYRSDKEVQEDPFTEEEAREMRRQDYLVLKKEFEGSEDA